MYEIVFDKQLLPQLIHPACGELNGGKYYFGVLLPVRFEDDEIVETYCIVTSDREWFPVTKEELEARNLKLLFPPVYIHRWSLDSVKEWLNGYVPPNTRQLAEWIMEEMKKYIDFVDERDYWLITLWCMGTYLLDVWDSYGYIGISGIFRTGKSKLLRFCEQITLNAINSAEISESALFRLIQSLRATVLMDEAEALANPEKKQSLKNLLYVGYKKSGKVYRTEKIGEQMRPIGFDIYSAKMYVTFTGSESVLAERTIPVIMLRTQKKEVGITDISPNNPIWQKIRDELYCWALYWYSTIKKEYENMNAESELDQRAWELWKPILCLAKLVGDDIFNMMKEYAVQKVKQNLLEIIEENRQMIVLRALLDYVTEDRYYTLSELKTAVEEFLEEGEDKKWVTVRWLGATLSKSFNITERNPQMRRPNRYITRKKIEELCKRYGIPIEREEETIPEGQIKIKIKNMLQEGKSWEEICQIIGGDALKTLKMIEGLDEKTTPILLLPCEFGELKENERECKMYSLRCRIANPEKCPLRGRSDENY